MLKHNFTQITKVYDTAHPGERQPSFAVEKEIAAGSRGGGPPPPPPRGAAALSGPAPPPLAAPRSGGEKPAGGPPGAPAPPAPPPCGHRILRIRSTAWTVASATPKPVRRIYPSPLGPKPAPGVVTTLASWRRVSKKAQEPIPAGVLTQT